MTVLSIIPLHTTSEDAMELWESIPSQHRAALERYFGHRIHPGDFLFNVLADNVQTAIHFADNESRAAIGDITLWLVKYAPRGSFGSVGAVTEYMGEDATE